MSKLDGFVYVHDGPHAGAQGLVEYSDNLSVVFRDRYGQLRQAARHDVKPSCNLDAIRDVDDLRRAVTAYGPRYFFSAATMKVWNSELEPWLWNTPKGVVFVTSERKSRSPFDTSPNRRHWTVRMFDGGKVIDISEFMAFGADGPAYRCAENYFRKETSG